ncbi:HD-GYP domain-containing protein [Alteromonas facilis]|uniref:HD-GYP domain-containing protein n=1 Tax=Alteromonas facilis TaxID=2048004 RepID=UPI000C287625|nr:HD domain-containing phosphohydrolase [Alteromonas facilis]
MLKEVPISELVPGMYVNQVLKQSGRLKMRSKGLVKSQATIEQLKQKGIELLEVDLSRSQLKQDADDPSGSGSKSLRERQQQTKKIAKSESDSLSAANDLYLQAVMIQGDFVSKIQKGGPANLEKVNELSQDLIDSIFDNTSAISCLTLIKDANEYLLEHSINCSVLMGIFARHMEFDRSLIEELSLGALLMDVGMAKVPKDVYDKKGELSSQDWQLVQSHVDIGVELIEQCEEVTDIVIDVIQNHHERMDGSGYPSGKHGQEISTYARMAAIVDCYDAMISERTHQTSQTPTQVLRKLLTDTSLDQALVQQFIKCIGVHPVGSLVKLRSEKLALVSSPGKKDPLSPVVMSFYSIRNNAHSEIKRIDLSKVEDEIVAAVKPSEFKMNLPKFFREVFIHQMPD